MSSPQLHVCNNLTNQGIAPTTLPKSGVWRLLQAWRAAFVPEVEAATGNQVYLGYEWHAYSYEFTRAVEGARAFAEYEARACTDYLVLSAWTSATFGFRCIGHLPDLRGKRWDLIVFPPELTWSMVFSHEDRCGPYFQENPRTK